MTSYQVGVAAESFVAALLSQSGYDVSVQYGANQPGYDLVAVKPGRTLQVSVKGSQDGGWGLAAQHLLVHKSLESLPEFLRRPLTGTARPNRPTGNLRVHHPHWRGHRSGLREVCDRWRGSQDLYPSAACPSTAS